jgi:hypothetical protein
MPREMTMSPDDMIPSIVVCGHRLMPYMSRVDVLVPILGLEGPEMDFVLDLHYSIGKSRSWASSDVMNVCAALVKKIECNNEIIRREVLDRCPDWNAEFAICQWLQGFIFLIGLTFLFDVIVWKRC